MPDDVLKFLRYRGAPMGEGRQVVSEALLEHADAEIVALRADNERPRTALNRIAAQGNAAIVALEQAEEIGREAFRRESDQ
ncbi:MAG: hypothetical protein AAGI03_09130 [Pseudomonadota bacterium]